MVRLDRRRRNFLWASTSPLECWWWCVVVCRLISASFFLYKSKRLRQIFQQYFSSVRGVKLTSCSLFRWLLCCCFVSLLVILETIFIFVLINIFIWILQKGVTLFGYSVNAFSCDHCGQECARACGTRHFRSCCLNYVRKRSSPPLTNMINDEISRQQQPLLDTALGVNIKYSM